MSGRDSRQTGRTAEEQAEDALRLGDPVEEFKELLLGPFEVDEYRRFMAEKQARTVELLGVVANQQRQQAPTGGGGGGGSETQASQVARRFSQQIDADSDIFGSDLQPERAGTFTIVISVDTSVTLSATISRTGEPDQTPAFNDGTALGASELYSFDLPVVPSLKYNYQMDAQATVEYAVVLFEPEA